MKYYKKRTLSALTTLMVVFGLIAMPLASAQPSNDDFNSATVISALPYTNEESTVDATTAADDPSCSGNAHSVWYSFTPTRNMRIAADTFGSDYDTTLSAYTGSRGSLTQVACNDDSGGSLQSKIVFNINAGETVYLMAASYDDSQGGDLKLSVNEVVPVIADLTIDPVGSVIPKNGIATVRGTLTCSKQATVDINSLLQQRSGRGFITGEGGTTLDCNGVTPWEVTITDTNGLFVGGKAEAAVFAHYEAGADSEDLAAMGEVQLKGSSPNK